MHLIDCIVGTVNIKDIMNLIKELISKSVYGVIFLLCLALFAINVYVTVSSYLNRVTIDIIKEQPITESVHLPTVAICLKEPFRNVMKHMFTLEDYDGNTRDPKNETFSFEESTFNNSWKEYYIDTFTFGKCAVFEMDKKVNRVRIRTEFAAK